MSDLSIIDAEFEAVPESEHGIRRAPVASAPAKSSQVTMTLERWLEVDRTVHELYQLCEFAIWQRDQARNSELTQSERAEALEEHVALLSTRLHLWMEENIQLERKSHETELEVERMRRVAAEALSLGAFDRRRRKELLAAL